MAEGKRVRVTRTAGGKKAGAAKAGGGVRAKPKKGGATAKPGGRVARPGRAKPAGKPAQTEEASAAPADADGLVDAIEAGVSKIVSTEVAELKTEVAELKGQIAELRQTFVDGITIFHDILAQTGGTLQYPAEDEEGNDVFDEDGNQIMENGPELYPKESKIFAYLDGTAFEEEEGEGGGEGEE